MSNLTDALIAAKLIGGSGGSGGGSGLPEITTEPVEVVAEQTVAFSSPGGGIYLGGIAGDFSVNVGDALIVNWDGTPYTCVATEFYGSPTWGNLSIEGAGADTGEPFLMANRPGNGIEIETLSGETHVCQISSMEQVPPDGYVLGVDEGEWKAVPSKGSELPKYGWQGAAIRWSNDLKWDAMPVAYVLYMESSGDIEGYDVFMNNPDVQDRVTFQTVYNLVHYSFMVPNIIMDSYNFGHIVSIDEQESTITVRFEDANGPTFYILRADPDTGELHGYASQAN